MKKAIAHIGPPKTGTTSIQDALHDMRERLPRTSGDFFRSVVPNLNNVLCISFFDDLRKHIEAAMEDFEKGRASSEKLPQEFQDDLKRAHGETMVLLA